MQTLFESAVAAEKLGDVRQAILRYLAILDLNPMHVETHHNLGALYFRLKQKDAAIYHLKLALAILPQNAVAAHMLELLLNPTQHATSLPYLKVLFDGYADHYEAHLKLLSYKVPDILFGLFERYIRMPCYAALDLGAGTGLCGLRFREHVSLLVGVDLSYDMLQEAEKKDVYDGLYEVDILTYLKESKQFFDLMIAGDVLVYYSDLTFLLAQMTRALVPNGYFVFNIESADCKTWCGEGTGRFKHDDRYILAQLAHAGFTLLGAESFALRSQLGVPVMGRAYCAQLKQTL